MSRTLVNRFQKGLARPSAMPTSNVERNKADWIAVKALSSEKHTLMDEKMKPNPLVTTVPADAAVEAERDVLVVRRTLLIVGKDLLDDTNGC